MEDNIINLARKLEALASRGDGGEKQNAKKLLEKFMNKHGLSLNDIKEDAVKLEVFQCTLKTHFILRQCIIKVMGSKHEVFRHKKKKTLYIVECNAAQKIEIQFNYDFYSQKYEEELEVFNKAFILKNGILPEDAKVENVSDMTGEERMRAKRALEMMKGIQKNDIQKKIDSSTNKMNL